MLKGEVYCYVPIDAILSVPSTLEDRIIRYEKAKTVYFRDEKLLKLYKSILARNPDLVWFTDDTILSSEMSFLLYKHTTTMMTVHDASGYHPVHNQSFRIKLHNALEMRLRSIAQSKVGHILVLSQNAKKCLMNKHPEVSEKILDIPLGAHIPAVEAQRPPEIEGSFPYFLFFGRIDKYKGLETILVDYSKIRDNVRLVIAGKGELSDGEKEVIACDSRVIHINRYIMDSEMV